MLESRGTIDSAADSLREAKRLSDNLMFLSQ
jgi:hypothetical protein